MTVALNWVVRMTSELETNIVAVERTKEYTDTPTSGVAIKLNPALHWPHTRRTMTINNGWRLHTEKERTELMLSVVMCSLGTDLLYLVPVVQEIFKLTNTHMFSQKVVTFAVEVFSVFIEGDISFRTCCGDR